MFKNSNKTNIDVKIIKKFSLFEGKRSLEEDQKIFNKIYSLCFDEMVRFLLENLSEDDLQDLNNELNYVKATSHQEFILEPSGIQTRNQILVGEKHSSSTTETVVLIIKYLSKIENSSFRFEKRLDYLINSLLYLSLKKAKSNKGTRIQNKSL